MAHVSSVQTTKLGSVYFDVDKFNPKDPTILVSGYGTMALSLAQKKLLKDIESLKDIASKGYEYSNEQHGEQPYRHILHLIDKNSIIQSFAKAIHDVYVEMENDPITKKKLRALRKKLAESVVPDTEFIRSIIRS